MSDEDRSTEGPAPMIRLSDYTPPPYLIDAVDLTIRLAPEATEVRARLALRRNPDGAGGDLRLDGVDLELVRLALDGRVLEFRPDDTGLTMPADALPAGPFTIETTVLIAPARNTALEGLYISGGVYCTQCEPEGFRKITFFPDRPDVMAPYRVRIEGAGPVLLSNGNLVASGAGWAEWHDPYPKPSYLFALVAGDLVARRERFTTSEGREVQLAIWVRPGDLDKTGFAMEALKRAMDWDERVYGRAYDLEQFNIVAVDDFNFGAMENKGLNIFNARYVLASPETATDADYAAIERIIAHEYFHNWTGNRITCRDWFQLSLKEGLTVYRDQQFTADMRGAAIQRIGDVARLRARQYPEDAGPLAHPVRPDAYVEINNFYTATVYEKGAEVIAMLAHLVGPQDYARALDLYFTRHDGQACTIEDWLTVFADVTGRDLSQFKLWYEQAGTPRLCVTEDWDGARLRLTLRQIVPPTPGQGEKAPMVIPVALGLIGADGREVMPTRLVVMDVPKMVLDLPASGGMRPVPSLLRGASAPVVLDHAPEPGALAHLLAHDTDPVARWDAGRRLALQELGRMVRDGGAPAPDWMAGLHRILADEGLEPAFRAQLLALPGEEEIARHLHASGTTPDPGAIHAARQRARAALAARLAQKLGEVATRPPIRPYRPDPVDAGRRALSAAALAYHSLNDGGRAAAQRFAEADNMTDSRAALSALLGIGAGAAELAAFHARWRADKLVLDAWFSLQAAHAAPDTGAEMVETLAAHPDFDWTNPNRFRALFGAFAGNHAGFHRADGAGYALLADWTLKMDARNPQGAARMTTAFETWARYDATRQAHARAALTRIKAHPRLSRDMGEMVERLLAG